MSRNVTIGNTVIPFPTSGTDANWSEPIVEFALAVAQVLQGVSLQFDVSPRVQLLSLDVNSGLNIVGANFPNGSVRKFELNYVIYRTNGSLSVIDAGTVTGSYDTLGSQWNLEVDFNGSKQADGTSWHLFSMAGDQLQLSTVAIGGSYDSTNSKISYSAKTELVSNLV